MNIRYLDINELNDRLEELEALRDAIADAREELVDAETDEDKTNAQSAIEKAESDFSVDDRAELKALEELRDEVGEDGGKISEDGAPFVNVNDFEDYAQELADDIGAIPKDAAWPCTCIDWKHAARELAYDYSIVTYAGTDYYYRS